MLTSLIPLNQMVDVFIKGIALELGQFGALFQAVSVLSVAWLILFWMYTRKIFIRA